MSARKVLGALKGLALFLAGLSLTLGVVGVLGMFAFGVGDCLLPEPDRFDAAGWRGASPDSPCSHRYPMTRDLIDNHIPPGMPRAEVVTMLGSEDDYGIWPEGSLAYSTGCWIDCNWLVIEFDGDGKVTRAYRAQD